MKMSYYCAASRDHHYYNMRAKRKKDLVAIRDADPEQWKKSYGPIVKIEFDYDDGFDLLQYCLGEGGASVVEMDAEDAMAAEDAMEAER